MRDALRPFRRVLARRNVTSLMTVHINKAEVKRFRQAVSGTHQINALSRSSLMVAYHPDGSGRRVLASGKRNYFPAAQPRSFTIKGKEFTCNRLNFHEPFADGFKDEDELTVQEILRGQAQDLTPRERFGARAALAPQRRGAADPRGSRPRDRVVTGAGPPATP